MVRGKVEMKRIENTTSRQMTFSKRRNGLLKKAFELAVLCDVEVGLIIFSQKGRLYEFSNSNNMQEIIKRYLERVKGVLSTDVEQHVQHLKDEAAFIAKNIELLENMHPSGSGNVPLLQNMPQTNTESTQHLIVGEEAKEVIIKVKYENDTIKFQLNLSSGIEKLVEEVARRLNLKKGSFKLKYVDEDDDEILIACDDDLKLCAKSLTAAGKTFIQLFV